MSPQEEIKLESTDMTGETAFEFPYVLLISDKAGQAGLSLMEDGVACPEGRLLFNVSGFPR